MKKTLLVFLVLIPFLGKSQEQKNFKTNPLHLSTNLAGGDITGSGGSVSYSMGQVFFSHYSTDDYYLGEGVQQPVFTHEIFEKKPEPEVNIRIAAYPNPATDYFDIKVTGYKNGPLQYGLTDLNGTLIEAGQMEKHNARVSISRLPVAVYMLMVSDNGKHLKTIKIIKN